MNIVDNDIKKALQALGQNGMNAEVIAEKSEIGEIETNANEVHHTTNTGFGKELVPTGVLMEKLVELIPKYSSFIGSLPGFHGTGLPVSAKVPVIGEVPFMTNNSEWTTGAPYITQSTKPHKMPTAEVTIEQAPLICEVDISKRELNYSIVDLESIVKERIARSAARTIEAMLLNSDTETGATGNINSDDQAPATTYGASHYSLILNNGIRKLGLGATGVDAGTLDMGDFLDVAKKLGHLFFSPQDCLWLTNSPTYLKAMGLSDFADASKRGASSTISGNAITNLYGADVFLIRDFPLTEADGKMSAIAGNNVLGGFALLYKPAVQHGYGQIIDLEVNKVAGKGIRITATLEWGFAIAQKLAGQTDSSVGLAMNITV
jgi:HK97 family phage major capsid protein